MLVTYLFSLAILMSGALSMAIDRHRHFSLPFPFPLPSSLPLPLPLPLPSSLPFSLPVPLPSSLPIPVPSSLPVPLPSSLPIPLPSTSPIPLPSTSPSASPSSSSSSPPSSTPTPSPSPSPSPSSAFKNIVFNSGVNDQPDIVGRFQTLQSHGVSSWIGFTLNDPSPPDPILTSNQIRMVLTEAQVQDGLALVTGANAPTYLQLLNEPDAGFYNQPILSPQQAAAALEPFFSITTPTTYLSPAPAYTTTTWLADFFAACNGCSSMFPIVTAHVYSPDPSTAISMIQNVMSQHPDKKIWITELSPASDESQGCTLDQAGVINWMNTVVGFANQQPQIERVFWNAGEAAAGLGDGGASCLVGLTQTDGQATALLEAYLSM